jgi:EAL domain-containing protein (putative c-di-GMP-specific phosphodiesterase class I)
MNTQFTHDSDVLHASTATGCGPGAESLTVEGGSVDATAHDLVERTMDDIILELRVALERNEFRLDYQPLVAAADQQLVGVEALLRWDHPVLGTVPPGWFIPMAEDLGLIVPIGTWVIEEACRQLAAWDAEGLPPITMSVNVSADQLCNPEFANHVRAALAANGLDGERLELEITENQILHPCLQRGIAMLNELRDIGVSVALDDFGTGYSNLARLKHLPLDRLKIDRSLIFDLDNDDDPRAHAISAAVMSLARAFGLALVAEGVETFRQCEILQRQGCEVLQGHLFGRARNAAAVAAMLKGAGCHA